MKNRRRKGIRAVILALATAAILVSAASGKTYEGGSAGYVTVASSTAPGYSPESLQAMSERWARLADYYQHSYSPEALQAMSERWTKMAESYQASRPDDRAGFRGVAPSGPSSDYVDRQLANLVAKAKLTAQALHVDDRAGIRGPGPVETPAVVSSHDGGFDWTDAGIGASVAFLTAAMLAAATLMRRRAGLAV
jgi:hypothetical protein